MEKRRLAQGARQERRRRGPLARGGRGQRRETRSRGGFRQPLAQRTRLWAVAKFAAIGFHRPCETAGAALDQHRLPSRRIVRSHMAECRSRPADSDGNRRDREIEADAPHSAQPRSEEHTSELQSLMRISYAVFCLKKKQLNTYRDIQTTT